MAERQHHAYGPSVLGRRVMCPGSARLEAQCPRVESEAAAEGTRLHEAVYDDAVAETLSEEDFALVQNARVFLRSIVAQGEWQYEGRVGVVDSDGVEILYGYADAVLFDHENKLAFVVDFKFGREPLPQRMATWQLAALCCGVFQQCGYPTMGYIYCPRTQEEYHV